MTLFRDFTPEVDPEARTFSGVLVPWNEPAEVRDKDGKAYREAFARGSFEPTAGQPVYWHHEYRDDPYAFPVGKVTEVRDEDDGLHIAGKLAETSKAADLHALMRDGIVTSLSAGFEPIEQENRSGVLVRTKAALAEVSVTPRGAYPGAVVTEVRSITDEAPASHIEGGASVPETTTYDDTEIRSAVEDLERRVATLATPAPVAGAVEFRSAGEALKALARGEDAAREVFTRAYSGAVTADTHIQNGWVERAIKLVDRGRPVINFFDREPLPDEGLTIAYPKIGTTTDGTGAQAAQGDDLGYFEVTTTTGTATVATFGNYGQVTRQVIERAPASYLDAVYRAQVVAYAKATEASVRTALTGAAGTNTQAMGATLAASTVAQWLSAVIDAGAAIDDNSVGLLADAVVVSRDVYKKLASFLDTAGRPVFGFTGGGDTVNGFGAGFGVVKLSGQIADLPVIVNSALAANTALVVSRSALVSYESAGAPVRLDDENIINLSKSFSVYGYLASAVVDAKGITKITFP